MLTGQIRKINNLSGRFTVPRVISGGGIEEDDIVSAYYGYYADLASTTIPTFDSTSDKLADWVIYGSSGGVGDLDSETGKYLIPITVKSKNILINSITSHTFNGLRVTVNEDKSITINGTASANSRFYIKNNVHTVNNSSLQELSNGTYIISGSPEGSSDGTYSLSYTYKKTSTTTSNTLIVPAGEEVTIDNTSSVYHLFAAFISVSSGTTLNNVTFKPMLRASGTTSEYVPFEKSVTIPVDSQLFIGDSVSMADTGIVVPLYVGSNDLTVGTTVQPRIQIKYEGVVM